VSGSPSGRVVYFVTRLHIFDPAQDHTRQTRRGFPCLQHVSFTPLGSGKLAVLANYPAQYMFEKAYGNYLGLYRLGRFFADQIKLDLTQFTCVVGKALPGDTPRATLRELVGNLQPHLNQTRLNETVTVESE
jgi:hypothetical protein